MTRSSKSVFIVNRDPDLAALYAEMLLMDVEKYIINTAYSGKSCLSTLKRYIPDLILVDIELDDMDGWDLIEKIKQQEPDIPIIIITAKPPQIEDFSRLTMISDYLIKPVTLDCLHMAAKDALEAPVILNKCMERVRNSPAKEEIISGVEENIRLMKQNIIDRKIFIIMSQIYPSKNDTHAKVLLNNLKKKIDRMHNEIDNFKNREYLLTDIKL